MTTPARAARTSFPCASSAASAGPSAIALAALPELLDGLCKRGTVVGADLVEVAPDYDHSGSTSILAAQVLLNLIGRATLARG